MSDFAEAGGEQIFVFIERVFDGTVSGEVRKSADADPTLLDDPEALALSAYQAVYAEQLRAAGELLDQPIGDCLTADERERFEIP